MDIIYEVLWNYNIYFFFIKFTKFLDNLKFNIIYLFIYF